MPSSFDIEHWLGDDRRPHVVARASQLGEAGQHVDFGQRIGGRLQVAVPRRQPSRAAARTRRIRAASSLLLGREDLLFVLFQLRRDVPLGVFERLLADVLGRHLFAMRVRDFQVIAEHLS